MLKRIHIRAISLIFIFLMLMGCVTSPPKRMNERFGMATETAKAQQTANPDASRNTAAVKGVDGQAGDAMFDNYRSSFINRPPPSTGIINIGTTGSSTGGLGSGGQQ
jgi:hypothetical protein